MFHMMQNLERIILKMAILTNSTTNNLHKRRVPLQLLIKWLLHLIMTIMRTAVLRMMLFVVTLAMPLHLPRVAIMEDTKQIMANHMEKAIVAMAVVVEDTVETAEE